jgi:hypothetical protein
VVEFIGRLATWVKPLVELRLRSTKKADSFVLLSAQLRRIWLDDRATAVRDVGGETGEAPADPARIKRNAAAAPTPAARLETAGRLIGSPPGLADFRRSRTPFERAFDHRKAGSLEQSQPGFHPTSLEKQKYELRYGSFSLCLKLSRLS